MRKLFFTSLLLIPFAANANTPSTAAVASTTYVQGAYDALDTSKQATLSSTNVTESGNGVFVSGVSASNGAVTVTKSDITLPVGSTSSSTRANVWIE